MIAPDSEAVFYGILDFCARPVFGALLIFGHRNIAPERLGLDTSNHVSRAYNPDSKRQTEGPGGYGMRTTLRNTNNANTNGTVGTDAHV